MVLIEIDDDVWDLFKKSWVLLGVREHEKLVEMLGCPSPNPNGFGA
jgi:hypothetical protein